MKKSILLGTILGCVLLKAQVVMGGGRLSNPYTQLELQNTTGKKVLILPGANNKTTLPKYNILQSDGYDDDITMQAMLMYDKNETTKVYDGKTWKPALIPKNRATTWTRARIGIANAGCVGSLCSSNNLPLSIPNNDVQFIDYLSIMYSGDTFRIRQKGLYRINFNILFSGINVGFSGAKVNVAIVVNNQEKAYMSSSAASFSSNSYLASADTVLFLDINNDVNFRITVDNGPFAITNYTFGGTPESNISLERIL